MAHYTVSSFSPAGCMAPLAPLACSSVTLAGLPPTVNTTTENISKHEQKRVKKMPRFVHAPGPCLAVLL